MNQSKQHLSLWGFLDLHLRQWHSYTMWKTSYIIIIFIYICAKPFKGKVHQTI